MLENTGKSVVRDKVPKLLEVAVNVTARLGERVFTVSDEISQTVTLAVITTYCEEYTCRISLRCSDCGANLNYKYTYTNPYKHNFLCKNNRAQNGICKKTHHIRVDMLTNLVRNYIANIV